LFAREDFRRGEDEFFRESRITEPHERAKRRQHDNDDGADGCGVVHGVFLFEPILAQWELRGNDSMKLEMKRKA
jgi:hypothetical protein